MLERDVEERRPRLGVDERPVAARLERFGFCRDAERDLNRRRCVYPYGHDRGEGISKQGVVPPICSNSTLETAEG